MPSKPPTGKGPPSSKPPGKKKPATLPSKKAPAGRGKVHTPKTFSVKPWTGEGEGEKIIVYGPSGIGKTTLAAMAPNAVFIGVDDGGRKIANPLTGEPIQAIDGVETFQDVLDVLAQDGLFADDATIVLDTVTKLEELIQNHIMATTPVSGKTVTSFRKYGWDGPDLILDQYRILMAALDQHARAGRNIILLAQQGQIKRASAESADYLEDGPHVSHTNRSSAREELKQWADHVFRIGYYDFEVTVEKGAKAGKVSQDDTSRAIFTNGALNFTAKSRPISGNKLPPTVSFATEDDNALWLFVFEGFTAEQE